MSRSAVTGSQAGSQVTQYVTGGHKQQVTQYVTGCHKQQGTHPRLHSIATGSQAVLQVTQYVTGCHKQQGTHPRLHSIATGSQARSLDQRQSDRLHVTQYVAGSQTRSQMTWYVTGPCRSQIASLVDRVSQISGDRSHKAAECK